MTVKPEAISEMVYNTLKEHFRTAGDADLLKLAEQLQNYRLRPRGPRAPGAPPLVSKQRLAPGVLQALRPQKDQDERNLPDSPLPG